MRHNKLIYVLTIIFFMPVFASAETMYVTDTLQVAVRSGMGVEHKILKYLKSDDRVEVLATEGEYAKLRFEDGLEGWMLKRYLTLSTPKPVVIRSLENQLKGLREDKSTLSEKIRKLKEEKKALQKTGKMNERKIATLEEEHEDLKMSCADFLKLKEDHEKLKKEMTGDKRRASELVRENEQLRKKNNLMWFAAGSSAVLIGFIIGLLLQNLRYKRKRQISF